MSEANVKIENADALRHPLAPLICAAVGFVPQESTYVDAWPEEETLVVRMLGDQRPADIVGEGGGGLFLYSVTDVAEGSEGPHIDLHYAIPAALAITLFKLQQVVQGVDNGETWQAVLEHICKPDVWATGGAVDKHRQWQAANRLAIVAPKYFEQAEKAAVLLAAQTEGGVH